MYKTITHLNINWNAVLFSIVVLFSSSLFAQIGTQSPSVQSGVTFQWNDIQDINFNGDIDTSENNRPASIRSIIINDGNEATVFDKFAIPTFYQLTRLGNGGSVINHSRNHLWLNGVQIVSTSATATLNVNDNNLWDTSAIAAFQDKNLNHYFEANPVGRNICGDFDAANGTNGVPETDAQLQTIFYDPALPSNEGGVLAVTERGGNNCYYIRMIGIPAGGGSEQVLGDTFVNNDGQDYRNLGYSPPLGNSDYWSSGREYENSQDIAIALFQLSDVAPTGSFITRIEFVAATRDHGDGKFFILQRYAEDLEKYGCEDSIFNGDIAEENNVPETSVYSVESAPSPAGAVQSFSLNADGTYTLVPTPGFVGVISFDYGVCLPAPNEVICDTATITVEFYPLPDPAVVEVSCPGNNNVAQITVVSPLGSQYEYSLDGGAFQASTVFPNIGEGSYEITVKNINTECESDVSTTVTFIEVEIGAITDVACYGASTGAININVSGGTAPYTYAWSNGATTEDLENVPAGDYTVTVTGANGCSDSDTYTIGQPAEDIVITGVVTDVSCFGASTGAIDISVSGGTSGYTYSWDNGASTQDITNLAVGEYIIVVEDANGCEKEVSFSVSGPNEGLNISFTKVDVLCNGASTGSVNITVSGGTAPYTYAWSNGAATEDVSSLPAGSYSVIVTDAKDCTLAQNGINIEEPSSPIGIVITKVNATNAQGCADGEATASASGGTGPYTYQWSASAGSQTGATASNLPSGNHTVVVTDANNCTLEQTVVIDCSNTCDQVIAVDNVTNVLCTSDTTGSATVSASSIANPSATYTFVWNTVPVQTDAGVTSSTISGQGAGVYTVSVTIDGTVCLPVEQSVTITEPTNALDVSASSTDESGPTTNDGTATANVSGGTPVYAYSWAPGGQTTQTITGLDEGTYTVTVTDANGCVSTATTVVNPGSCQNLAVTATPSGVTCNGDSDGTVDATITGGSGNFTYSWDNGATTEDISALAGGVYTITVTDTVTLCTATANATVIEPNVLSSGIAVNSVLCFGESTGSLDLTVSGGTAPYSFAWSNGATTEDINTLSAGVYSVVITDVNGCRLNDSAEVLEPAAELTAQVDSQVDVLCGAESSVTVSAQGGTLPYSYSLDGATGQANGIFTDLAAGTYVVTVVDGNGCTIDVDFDILSNCTDAIDDINDTFINVAVDGNVLTNDE
ncbi:hypothetical protein, partial [Patiriisocius marinus]|uniref:hypothetical protein n=1 Tax=Patiriisocius marinus TaxID=1397112 RepID=UPI00232E8AC9